MYLLNWLLLPPYTCIICTCSCPAEREQILGSHWGSNPGPPACTAPHSQSGIPLSALRAIDNPIPKLMLEESAGVMKPPNTEHVYVHVLVPNLNEMYMHHIMYMYLLNWLLLPPYTCIICTCSRPQHWIGLMY